MGPSSSCESVPRSCLPHTNPHRLTISHQAFTRAHRLYAVCLLRLYGGISDVLKELFDDWDNDARSEGVVSALYFKKTKNNPRPPQLPGPPDPRRPRPGVLAGSLAPPATHSRSSLLTSLRITRPAQVLSPRGRLSPCVVPPPLPPPPLQNSLFMPRHNVSG